MKIREKLTFISVLITTIPVLLIGWYVYNYTKDSELEAQKNQINNKVSEVGTEINMVLEEAGREIEFLSKVPPIQGILRAQENGGEDTITKSSMDQWKGRLSTIFSSVHQTKNLYNYVGYYSAEGEPFVLTNNKGKFKTNGIEVTGERLNAPLLLKAKKSENKYSVSDLVWDKENGSYYVEIVKSIYYVGDDMPKGILVLNLDAIAVIKAVQSNEENGVGLFTILNKDNELLFGKEDLPIEKIGLSGITLSALSNQEVDDKFIVYHKAGVDKSNGFWTVIYSIDSSELYAFGSFFQNLFIRVGLSLLISIGLSFFFAKKLSQGINKVRNHMKSMSKGKLPKIGKVTAQDELGEMTSALKGLIKNQRETAAFAKKIGEGDLKAKYKLLGKDDKLGLSLIEMRENLIKAEEELAKKAEEDKIRNWINENMASFGQLLRNNGDDIQQLTDNIMSSLVKTLKCNQGGLYLIESEGDDEFLTLRSCYAFDTKKHTERNINKGEGMIGQSWEEGLQVYLTNVPEDYINITSGLGDGTPSCLIIQPLKINETIVGVIELASFTPLEEHYIEFLEKISEGIASAISSMKVNEVTARLLHDSQQKANELRSQEEELRQNLEEMESIQENMNRKEKELIELNEQLKRRGIRVETNS